jgi:hypothetical protein
LGSNSAAGVLLTNYFARESPPVVDTPRTAVIETLKGLTLQQLFKSWYVQEWHAIKTPPNTTERENLARCAKTVLYLRMMNVPAGLTAEISPKPPSSDGERLLEWMENVRALSVALGEAGRKCVDSDRVTEAFKRFQEHDFGDKLIPNVIDRASTPPYQYNALTDISRGKKRKAACL